MKESLYGVCLIVLYFLCFAMLAFTLRALINIPNEVFNKTLHFILLGSLYIWTFVFET